MRKSTDGYGLISIMFLVFGHVRMKNARAKSVGRSSTADGFADKFAVPFNRVTFKGCPLEMDVEMDFRVSEWPTNRVASTENLDIGYSGLALIQQRSSRWKRRAREKFRYSICVRTRGSDKIRQFMCQAWISNIMLCNGNPTARANARRWRTSMREIRQI